MSELENYHVGIRFSHIEQFILACGGRSTFMNQTTQDVCQRFVIPRTEDSKLSYSRMLYEEKKTNESTLLRRSLASSEEEPLTKAFTFMPGNRVSSISLIV
jgi:hypothetical protein